MKNGLVAWFCLQKHESGGISWSQSGGFGFDAGISAGVAGFGGSFGVGYHGGEFGWNVGAQLAYVNTNISAYGENVGFNMSVDWNGLNNAYGKSKEIEKLRKQSGNLPETPGLNLLSGPLLGKYNTEKDEWTGALHNLISGPAETTSSTAKQSAGNKAIETAQQQQAEQYVEYASATDREPGEPAWLDYYYVGQSPEGTPIYQDYLAVDPQIKAQEVIRKRKFVRHVDDQTKFSTWSKEHLQYTYRDLETRKDFEYNRTGGHHNKTTAWLWEQMQRIKKELGRTTRFEPSGPITPTTPAYLLVNCRNNRGCRRGHTITELEGPYKTQEGRDLYHYLDPMPAGSVGRGKTTYGEGRHPRGGALDDFPIIKRETYVSQLGAERILKEMKNLKNNRWFSVVGMYDCRHRSEYHYDLFTAIDREARGIMVEKDRRILNEYRGVREYRGYPSE